MKNNNNKKLTLYSLQSEQLSPFLETNYFETSDSAVTALGASALVHTISLLPLPSASFSKPLVYIYII